MINKDYEIIENFHIDGSLLKNVTKVKYNHIFNFNKFYSNDDEYIEKELDLHLSKNKGNLLKNSKSYFYKIQKVDEKIQSSSNTSTYSKVFSYEIYFKNFERSD